MELVVEEECGVLQPVPEAIVYVHDVDTKFCINAEFLVTSRDALNVALQ